MQIIRTEWSILLAPRSYLLQVHNRQVLSHHFHLSVAKHLHLDCSLYATMLSLCLTSQDTQQKLLQ